MADITVTVNHLEPGPKGDPGIAPEEVAAMQQDIADHQTDITSLEQDVLAINTDLGEKEAEIAALQEADVTLQQNIDNEATARSEADTVRLKSVVVPTYADMLTQATGEQVLIFGVTADEMNMGGDKGAYIYIPSFGIGQIAINFS